MTKLNYSRFVHLKAIIGLMLEDKDVSDHIVNEIKTTQMNHNKYFRITDSDKLYIKYLKQLLKINNNHKQLTKIQNSIDNHSMRELKIVMYAQETTCWPSQESIYLESKNRNDIVVNVVYVPFKHVNKTSTTDYYMEYKNHYCPEIMHHDKYNVSKDSPDVAIFMKPYDNEVPPTAHFRNVERVVKRTVYIPYGMEFNHDLILYCYCHYAQVNAWKHIAYGNVVKEYGVRYGYRNGDNIAVWGHPKGDSLLNTTIPESWNLKIHGRPVILWTPHHTIDQTKDDSVSTWLEWHNIILDYFECHKEAVLLFRPHPLLFGALINNNIMTKDEIDQLIEKFNNSDNMILDLTADYRPSFVTSNGIITDGSTFSVEYFYTGKPEMITPKHMESFFRYSELIDCVYVGDSETSIISFINMVVEGKDPMKDKRLRFADSLLYVPNESSIANNIIDNIIQCINEEESIID